MGVVAIRVGTMPGFTELALDAPLAQLLGTENYGALLRLCHLAQPSGDVPGSWVFAHNQVELAEYLGCSKNKAASILRLLCESGALARDRGIRLGRSMGATTDRYFITAIPGLTSPATATPPTHPPRDRSPQPVTELSSPSLSKLKNTTVKTTPVITEPELVPAASQTSDGSAPDLGHLINVISKDLLDEEKQQPKTHQLLKTALARIGWDRDLPQHRDPLLVAQVATWLASNSVMENRAGYLNTILRNGDLETFAQSKGLVGNTRVNLDRPGFTSAQYVQLRTQFPQWEEHVQQTAALLATERGVPVRMALLCEVAATIELPEQVDTQVITREVGA